MILLCGSFFFLNQSSNRDFRGGVSTTIMCSVVEASILYCREVSHFNSICTALQQSESDTWADDIEHIYIHDSRLLSVFRAI